MDRNEIVAGIVVAMAMSATFFGATIVIIVKLEKKIWSYIANLQSRVHNLELTAKKQEHQIDILRGVVDPDVLRDVVASKIMTGSVSADKIWVGDTVAEDYEIKNDGTRVIRYNNYPKDDLR